METQYTFRGKENATLTKLPGSVQGKPFVVSDCRRSTILILDNCECIQIDHVSDSKIFIGASSGSVFLRNCTNCTVTLACKQFRTRDCKECVVNLYCMSQPIIETSTGMQFSPFNGAYPGHINALTAAGLDVTTDKWSQVYDFNDPSNSGENWSVIGDDQVALWCPLGEAECCFPGCNASRRLFGDEEVNSDEDTKFSATVAVDEGPNRFVQLGQRLWNIMSHSISVASAFCLGFILNSIDSGRRLLTWSG